MKISRRGRYTVGAGLVAFILSACGGSMPAASTPGVADATATPATTAMATVAPTATIAPTATVAPTATAAPVQLPAAPTSTGLLIMTPEEAIHQHFRTSKLGADRIVVRSLEVVNQINSERQYFQVALEVVLLPGVASPWNNGLNTRFVTVEKIAGSWKVTEVATAPTVPVAILAPTQAASPTAQPGRAGFQRVGGRDLGITFEVPAAWTREAGDYTFRQTAGAPVTVGVARPSVQTGVSERALLPNRAQIVREEPVDLGWARGTKYTVKVSQPAAGHEVHVILKVGGKAVYHIFSAAPANDAGAIKAAEDARLHLVRTVAVVGG